MPIRKQYECTDSLNLLEVSLNDAGTELRLKITDEDYHETRIYLTRNDLLDLIGELELLNEFLYENEKGGSNG